MVRHQHFLNVRGRYRLAASFDSFLGTPCHEQVAIGVQVANVARLKPAIVPDAIARHAASEVRAVGQRLEVPPEDRAAAHGDCTHLAGGQRLASLVLDLHLGADRNAGRSGLL